MYIHDMKKENDTFQPYVYFEIMQTLTHPYTNINKNNLQ